MNKAITVVLLCIMALQTARADEGMWLPYMLHKKIIERMKEKGLKLAGDEIFDKSKPSLNDAIVSLNDGNCSASLISNNGLLITNHHCGYDAIASLSTLANNYLDNGFTAPDFGSELHCPGLSATIIRDAYDVTEYLPDTLINLSEEETRIELDKISIWMQKELNLDDNHSCRIESFYNNMMFVMFVQQRFNDVRLVAAPPSHIGKFGGDTDNWMWPRHTGDFCVFRVYASPDNNPASYSKENRPYRPEKFLEISSNAIKKGDFSMVMGFPGTTNRFATSEDIAFAKEYENPIIAKVRGMAQSIWKEAMDSNESLKLKYSTKYSNSSNYWKYAIGQNLNISNNNLIERRNTHDINAMDYCKSQEGFENISESDQRLKDLIKRITPVKRAQTIYHEALFNPSEVTGIFFDLLHFSNNITGENIDEEEGIYHKSELTNSINAFFDEYDIAVERKVFTQCIKYLYENLDEEFRPNLSKALKRHHNSIEEYIGNIFDKSMLTNKTKALQFAESGRKTSKKLMKDELSVLMLRLIMHYQDIDGIITEYDSLTQVPRQVHIISSTIEGDSPFYPDANSTLRLSYGTIEDYKPADGVTYSWMTTLKGIVEKADEAANNADYAIPDELRNILTDNISKENNIPVCFITNNDITGGNSGSPVLNGMGQLIGLAFDGNWEAMASDFEYDEKMQRCVCVDIRYVLFVLDNMGIGKRIRKEITFGTADSREKTAEIAETVDSSI